ncbi:MAG: hypothetical protein AUJ55_09460 [Proteobacteria bacterium CG1_02_64_396]|nr:MAG: hypothetical protein AUJ55_09460 [Proteobacteria bacterium CG1_02_64_396]
MVAGWSALASVSMGWNILLEREEAVDMAAREVQAYFIKDLAYRDWNAHHGGVYVEVSPDTPPNPYLKVPERDIDTPSGRHLTLVNPSYMTRQVFEQTSKKFGIHAHITSLKPIRPENAPDPWERKALGAFERGAKEVMEISDIDGQRYLRLMRPLVTEKPCLKCHEAQGYKVGDIRGGISTSASMAPHEAISNAHMLAVGLGHSLLWLVGMLGIGFFSRRLQTKLEQEQRTAHRLVLTNRSLRTLSAVNQMLVWSDRDEELIEGVCSSIVDIGQQTIAWIALLPRPDAPFPALVACSRQHFKEGQSYKMPDPEQNPDHPIWRCWRDKAPLVIEDLPDGEDPTGLQEQGQRLGFRSMLVMPLRREARIIGMMGIHNHLPHAFSAEEIDLFLEMGGDLAFGLHTLAAQQEHQQAQEAVDFLSHYDQLTHLPNRVMLRHGLETSLDKAQAEGGWAALLALDLAGFRRINDSVGHEAGDRLLQEAARRIQRAVRPQDLVARTGGDDFAIVLQPVHSQLEVEELAQQILNNLTTPVRVQGLHLRLEANIGISLYPQDGQQPDLLLQQAAAALDESRKLGRQRYQFFYKELGESAMARVRLDSEIALALSENQFVLYYQPQINLETGRIVGVEALVRWIHPLHDLTPPQVFIPHAEESGLILPLGAWVLKEGCAQLSRWLDAGLPPLTMGINLSPRQFAEAGLLETIAQVIEETNIPPHLLELEITEGMAMENVQHSFETLEALHRLGVKVAIDDFGTGYSSLGYLRRFPLNTMKIDQSFIVDLTQERESRAIVDAIVGMSHSLGLTVIAEGVETPEQLAVLGRLGCDEVQGFLFSTPLPSDQMENLLRTPPQWKMPAWHPRLR